MPETIAPHQRPPKVGSRSRRQHASTFAQSAGVGAVENPRASGTTTGARPLGYSFIAFTQSAIQASATGAASRYANRSPTSSAVS